MKDIGNSRKEDLILIKNLPESLKIMKKSIRKEGISLRLKKANYNNFYAYAVFFDGSKFIKKVDFIRYKNTLRISGAKFRYDWNVKFYLGKKINNYHLRSMPYLKRTISVIIPCRNNHDLLIKTLASLENQSILPLEVIICDDNSKKRILIPKNLGKKYDIKILRNKSRMGSAFSRNKAIKKSKGDIILCLDSDMIAERNLIKEHLIYHGKSKNRAVLGKRVFIDSSKISAKEIIQNKFDFKLNSLITQSNRTGRIEDSRNLKFQTSNNLRNEAFPWMYFSTCNVSFSRKSFDKINGFNEQFFGWGYEDNEFGFRLFKIIKGFKIVPNLNAIAYHQEHERDLKKLEKEAKENFNIFLGTVKRFKRSSI